MRNFTTPIFQNVGIRIRTIRLWSIVIKKYRHHSSRDPIPEGKENLLNQKFEADRINQKWCTDITYIQ